MPGWFGWAAGNPSSCSPPKSPQDGQENLGSGGAFRMGIFPSGSTGAHQEIPILPPPAPQSIPLSPNPLCPPKKPSTSAQLFQLFRCLSGGALGFCAAEAGEVSRPQRWLRMGLSPDLEHFRCCSVGLRGGDTALQGTRGVVALTWCWWHF